MNTHKDKGEVKMKKKIMEIEWIDSLAGNGKWTWLKDLEIEEYKQRIKHRTVGYVVFEEKDFIALTDSMQDFEYEDGDVSIVSPIFIPKIAITKKRIIK